jgi:elongation factor P
MIGATDLKNGTTFEMNGKPYKVVKYSHQKIGRGGASIKLRIRNLKTGDLEDKTFSSNNKFDEIVTTKQQMQYLFSDGGNATFMDPGNYDQLEIPANTIKDELAFIKEGDNVDVHLWDGKPLSLDIPPKVTLEVVDTVPGVKGDTASNVYKSAKLENGLDVKVPLFINQGDKIRVDTRTGEYVERTK